MPQGSTLGRLFFVKHIKILYLYNRKIEPIVKLYAYGTSLFPVVHDSTTVVNIFHKNLEKISEPSYI